jgi:hypothetical protein
MVPSEAEDGNRALELLRAAAQHEPFDIVLMDMDMPGIDGFDLARTIKADSSIPSSMALRLRVGSKRTRLPPGVGVMESSLSLAFQCHRRLSSQCSVFRVSGGWCLFLFGYGSCRWSSLRNLSQSRPCAVTDRVR